MVGCDRTEKNRDHVPGGKYSTKKKGAGTEMSVLLGQKMDQSFNIMNSCAWTMDTKTVKMKRDTGEF